MQQQFLINIQNNLSFYYLNKDKYFIYKINNFVFYFYIPNYVKIQITECKKICFFTRLKTVNILLFKTNLLNWINKLTSKIIKKLIFKGLGLKAQLNSINNTLELKLGFSHIVFIKVPKNICVQLIKRRIIIEGYDKISLGNFAFKIKAFKFPNIYKGKGIWYNREILTLKPIKKS